MHFILGVIKHLIYLDYHVIKAVSSKDTVHFRNNQNSKVLKY